MQRERLTWLALLHLAVDAVVLVGVLVTVAYFRAEIGAWWPFDWFPGDRAVLRTVDVGNHAALSWVVLPTWLAVLALRGRYRRLPADPRAGRLPGLIVASGLSAVMLLGLVRLLGISGVSRTVVVGFAAATVPALLFARALAHAIAVRTGPPIRVRLIGPDADTQRLAAQFAVHPMWAVTVVERRTGGLEGVADGVDEVVVLRTGRSDDFAEIVEACEEVGVPVSVEATFLGTRTSRVELRDLPDTTLVTFSSGPRHGLVVKRLLDIAGAALGLMLLGPLVGVLALVVRLWDGASPFFVQERVGRHGRTFRMYKLRSMRVGAESEQASLAAHNELNGPAFKLANDPRVTAVGRWLRRTSADELPQLLNVLKGDMSLVGPRPPLPGEVAQYERWQRRRLSMRPGITGLWQVTARGGQDVDRWIELDLAYIDAWSLTGDLSLLLRTLPAVLTGRGAR